MVVQNAISRQVSEPYVTCNFLVASFSKKSYLLNAYLYGLLLFYIKLLYDHTQIGQFDAKCDVNKVLLFDYALCWSIVNLSEFFFLNYSCFDIAVNAFFRKSFLGFQTRTSNYSSNKYINVLYNYALYIVFKILCTLMCTVFTMLRIKSVSQFQVYRSMRDMSSRKRRENSRDWEIVVSAGGDGGGDGGRRKTTENKAAEESRRRKKNEGAVSWWKLFWLC